MNDIISGPSAALQPYRTCRDTRPELHDYKKLSWSTSGLASLSPPIASIPADQSSPTRVMGNPIPANPPTESLTVRDERTGKTYSIPIVDNTIPATAFK
jgi:hypothetical protein